MSIVVGGCPLSLVCVHSSWLVSFVVGVDILPVRSLFIGRLLSLATTPLS